MSNNLSFRRDSPDIHVGAERCEVCGKVIPLINYATALLVPKVGPTILAGFLWEAELPVGIPKETFGMSIVAKVL